MPDDKTVDALAHATDHSLDVLAALHDPVAIVFVLCGVCIAAIVALGFRPELAPWYKKADGEGEKNGGAASKIIGDIVHEIGRSVQEVAATQERMFQFMQKRYDDLVELQRGSIQVTERYMHSQDERFGAFVEVIAAETESRNKANESRQQETAALVHLTEATHQAVNAVGGMMASHDTQFTQLADRCADCHAAHDQLLESAKPVRRSRAKKTITTEGVSS